MIVPLTYLACWDRFIFFLPMITIGVFLLYMEILLTTMYLRVGVILIMDTYDDICSRIISFAFILRYYFFFKNIWIHYILYSYSTIHLLLSKIKMTLRATKI